MGTKRTKCCSKFVITSMIKSIVELENLGGRVIDIVSTNMKRINLRHSTSEARE